MRNYKYYQPRSVCVVEAIMKLYTKFLVISILSLFFAKNSYSQVSGWSEIGKMKFPVSGGQAVFNGSKTDPKIFILGGYSQTHQQDLSFIQVFDPRTFTWEVYPPPLVMKSNRSGFIAARWDSSIVYLGGGTNDYLESFNFTSKSVPVILDSNINFSRKNSSGLVVGDELYILSGSFPPNDTLRFIVSYNLKSRSISYRFDFPTNSKFKYSGDAAVFLAEDQIFILGGVVERYLSKMIRRFDVVKKTLQNLSSFPLLDIRAGGSAAYISSSKKGILVGGYNETDKALNTAEQIVVMKDGSIEVSHLPPMKYARSNPTTASYNGKVFVFGGTDNENNVVSQVEMYTDTSAITEINSTVNVPAEFYLEQNYPNPFNPATSIRYGLSKESFVTIKVFNILGEEVVTLVNKIMNAGYHNLNFDAAHLTSGVYIYKIEAGNFIQAKKMLLIK
jgi:hypothetical protein